MQVTQLSAVENCARRRKGRSPKPEGDITSWKMSLLFLSSAHQYNLVNRQGQIEVVHKAYVTAH